MKYPKGSQSNIHFHLMVVEKIHPQLPCKNGKSVKKYHFKRALINLFKLRILLKIAVNKLEKSK